MNKTFKKILTTTLIGVSTAGAIGCASPNSKLAEKINNGMNDFVTSINKLDYVDTNNSNSSLGKIVSAAEEANFFSKVAKTNNIENTITKPSDRSDNFKLYVLADSPFISLTSDDNSISLSMQFSTEKIENTSDDISEKINKLILKRAILMVYVNEIYNGNVNLTDENRTAINAYVNVIKENTSFLNGNRGMVKNQLGMASDLINSQSNDNIINYYIIKSGEALEIRSNKIDSTISAIDSITNILEQNLTSSSCYYQNSLTNAYNNMITNMKNNTSDNENQTIAKQIAESINLLDDNSSNYDNEVSTLPLNTINNKSVNNSNCIDCKNTTRNNVTNNKTINNSTNTVNNQQFNRNINNNLTKRQTNQNIENSTTDKNNNIMTLDEKTQNNSKISEIPNRNNEINGNFKNITPAQRERIRRQRRLNNTNNNNPNANNPTLDANQNTVINNSKTIHNDRNITTSNTPIQNRNWEINTYDNTRNNNRAVRVPYTINSNVND